jgi:hypothetical protein
VSKQPIIWSYGVTTVSSRSDQLIATLWSLRSAGFPEPRLFVDSVIAHPGNAFSLGLECTIRYPPVGITGNCLTGLAEPHPDYVGWYKSNQLGRGAVGLVFDRTTIWRLLGSKLPLSHRMYHQAGHKCVDGAIINAMREAGCTELVHSPSLLQHTGGISSSGNPEHPQGAGFRGETFDAMQFVNEYQCEPWTPE